MKLFVTKIQRYSNRRLMIVGTLKPYWFERMFGVKQRAVAFVGSGKTWVKYPQMTKCSRFHSMVLQQYINSLKPNTYFTSNGKK